MCVTCNIRHQLSRPTKNTDMLTLWALECSWNCSLGLVDGPTKGARTLTEVRPCSLLFKGDQPHLDHVSKAVLAAHSAPWRFVDGIWRKPYHGTYDAKSTTKWSRGNSIGDASEVTIYIQDTKSNCLDKASLLCNKLVNLLLPRKSSSTQLFHHVNVTH